MRKIILLDKNWTFYKNPDSTQGEEVSLPHTWNAVDGQDGGNDYYRGTCKYECHFSRPELETDGKAYLEFDGAAMTADVVINGTKAVHHEGGQQRQYGVLSAESRFYILWRTVSYGEACNCFEKSF